MDPQLKQLMKELGDAINKSLKGSKEISEVASRIKEGGYDHFLVLEANIGVSKRGVRAPDKTSCVTTMLSNPELKISDQDDTLTESELNRRSASSVENSRDDRGGSMDPQLKQLMEELGDAINKSLKDSKEISEVASRIKAAWYDIFLNVEATIGVSNRGVKAPAPDKTLEWEPPQIRYQDDTPDGV